MGISRDALINLDQYEEFNRQRFQEIQKEVEEVWKLELSSQPKCIVCAENRIMYSLFCKEHTHEHLKLLLENSDDELPMGLFAEDGKMEFSTNILLAEDAARLLKENEARLLKEKENENWIDD